LTLRVVHPLGRDYLRLVTQLLQDARLADPDGGIWEAADLNWWWRVDQHENRDAQSIWLDGDSPVVAVDFTRWKAGLGCDLLGTDVAVAQHAGLLWDLVRDRFTDRPVEMLIRDDDPTRIAAAEQAGFVAGSERFASGWMDVEDRPTPPPLPAGLRIALYEGGAHPMVARNGGGVAQRLAECPLYRPDLDLSLRDGDELAGYALFWADPVTGVGLLEPMRIEDAYQGRGLSKALIAAGLERIAAAGCHRLKVSWEPSNEPAVRLYTGAGYRLRSIARNWTRPARG
jgi:ribosomal protein S18 acetylase RimI-like enzyme